MKAISASIVVLSSALIFVAAAISGMGEPGAILCVIASIIAVVGMKSWRNAMKEP